MKQSKLNRAIQQLQSNLIAKGYRVTIGRDRDDPPRTVRKICVTAYLQDSYSAWAALDKKFLVVELAKAGLYILTRAEGYYYYADSNVYHLRSGKPRNLKRRKCWVRLAK